MYPEKPGVGGRGKGTRCRGGFSVGGKGYAFKMLSGPSPGMWGVGSYLHFMRSVGGEVVKGRALGEEQGNWGNQSMERRERK